MRTIYSAANSVWCWLGEGDPQAELGLLTLYHLSKELSIDAFEPVDHGFVDTLGAVQGAPESPGEENLTRNIDTRPHDAICAILSVPYWHRGWILQEATANHSTRLCYGQLHYGLRSWCMAGESIQIESARTKDFNLLSLSTMLGSFYALALRSRVPPNGQASMMEQDPVGDTKAAMVFLYAFHTDWQTSDPRDRVYAVLGSMPGLLTLGINIDYGKPVEDVFIETSVAILNASQTWSHVSFIRRTLSHCLPSWAIDFTSHLEPHDIDYNLPESEHFNAAVGAKFRLTALGSDTLLTAGFLLDEIEWVSSNLGCCMNESSPAFILNHQRTMSRTELQNHKFERIQHETKLFVIQAARRIHCICPEGRDNLFTACWRTMCAGRVDHKTEFGRAHAAAIRGDADFKSLLDVLNRICRKLEHSKLMITREGYIGLVPLSAEVGDSIAIIATAKLPFVLRKVEAKDVEGDAYIMKGGCYVDGIMHGEAVKNEALRLLAEMEQREASREAFWFWRDRMAPPTKDRLQKIFAELAFGRDICLV